MKIDRSFGWLGRFPLAVDLADTVRVVGSEDVELLTDETALSAWITAEMPRFEFVTGARGHLSEVRELRDAVRRLLHDRLEGRPLSRDELGLINEAASRSPSYPTLTEDGGREIVETSDDAFGWFVAEVARSAIEAISSSPLALCRAPSCGMFFRPENARQRWCSPACGNRARVARHAARTAPHHGTR